MPGRLTHRLSWVKRSPRRTAEVVTTEAYAKSMVGCSSGSTFFWPPSASKTARLPTINWRSSSGVMLMGPSGPGQLVSEVKCFSSSLAPSGTAARHV